MNARTPDGRRYSQTWFDPAAPRLSGTQTPLPSREREGPAAKQWEGEGVSLTTPLPTDAEQADDQAALIRGFDPVELSLAQIETLQALLSAAAATRRALRDDPAADPDVLLVTEAAGSALLEHGTEEDETGAYHRPDGEAAWHMLDPEGLAEVARIDEAVASVKAAKEAERRAGLPEIAREVGVAVFTRLKSAAPRRQRKSPSPRT